MQVWGYIPDFDLAAAFASVHANRAHLTGVTQVLYHLDAAGDLVPYPGAQAAPSWVCAAGLPVVPLIANQIDGRWDHEVVGHVLGDPSLRHNHVQRIVACTGEHHSAVELDYEFLSDGLRDVFSTFVEELAAALHAQGKQLAVAVHAKLSEPGPADGPAGQDWTRIGGAADRVAVMTYDFDPNRPGPVAPIAWTREVLTFAASCIAPTKVMQGVPLYGYVWAEGEAPQYVTHREFSELSRRHGVAPRRDSADHHLVLEYQEHGTRVVAWLPDVETVAALASVGRQVGVAGYTVWRLGGEQPTALTALGGSSG